MSDMNLQYLKNWNGYLPSTGTGELKEFELKWWAGGIELSKTISVTQENWDYMTLYLRLDTDAKKLEFFKNCDDNGRGNAILDQKNRLLVEEAYGETMVISEIVKLVPDFSPTAEESVILENTPGGYEHYLQAIKQLSYEELQNSSTVFQVFDKIKNKLLPSPIELPKDISDEDKLAIAKIFGKYNK